MRRPLFASLALLFSIALTAACGGGGDDSTLNPDAGAVDAGPQGNPETFCEALPAAASGVCSMTGTSTADGFVIKGDILAPETLYRGGQVAVDGTGVITCVGCDCVGTHATVITCPEGVVSPGLINTHDHITFSQNSPYIDATGERYEQRHDWRKGRRGHTRIPSPGNASPDEISWAELRFLMGGATSTVAAGQADGLVRNLDAASASQGGLNQTPINSETFPLDDSGGTQRNGDCNYGGTPDTSSTIASVDAYEPHISEGIDAEARNEFLCTSSTLYDTVMPGVSNDIVQGKTAIIHGVGLTPVDYAAMATDGTKLIWSPRSNVSLYGDTAQVVVADRLGVQIALGTDWILSGSMNMQRELACAASLNDTYYDHYFSDKQLWAMATGNAAAATATDDVIGALAVGKVADIAIFDGRVHKDYRAIIDGEPRDVTLVMRGGKALYGDDALVDGLVPTGCDPVDVCTVGKKVCLTTEIDKTYAVLKAAVGSGDYPDFQCGVPTDEPSCVPSRPVAVNGSTVYTGLPLSDDSDGDGIANTGDDCPTVFNPIRPLDDGQQADADADGDGDACDVCPLNADSTTCTAPDSNDRDGDGVTNVDDNCPDVANPPATTGGAQLDADGDLKGDACDACPLDPNPAGAACPATIASIYQVKDGTVASGAAVEIVNAIITGKGDSGFFIQIKEGDAGYLTFDNSGLFVFTGRTSTFLTQAVVGNRITIDGTVNDFFGELQLKDITLMTITSATVEAPPAPINVNIFEVTTGGTRAAALEAVLVRLPTATVTVAASAGTFGEFTIGDLAPATINVDDFLLPVASSPPAGTPAVGTTYSSVTGVLAFRNNASKIENRSAADLPVQ